MSIVTHYLKPPSKVRSNQIRPGPLTRTKLLKIIYFPSISTLLERLTFGQSLKHHLLYPSSTRVKVLKVKLDHFNGIICPIVQSANIVSIMFRLLILNSALFLHEVEHLFQHFCRNDLAIICTLF